MNHPLNNWPSAGPEKARVVGPDLSLGPAYCRVDVRAGGRGAPLPGWQYHFTYDGSRPAGDGWVLLGADVAEGKGAYFWVRPPEFA